MGSVDIKFRNFWGIAINVFFIIWLFMFFNFFGNTEGIWGLFKNLIFEFSIFGIIWGVFFFGAISIFLYRFITSTFYIISQKPVISFDYQGIHIKFPFRGFIAWENIEALGSIGATAFTSYFVINTKAPTELSKKSRRRKFFTGGGGFFSRKDDDNLKIQLMYMDFGGREQDIRNAAKNFQSLGKKFEFHDL